MASRTPPPCNPYRGTVKEAQAKIDSLARCTCGAAYLARGREPDARPGTTLHVTNGACGRGSSPTAGGGAGARCSPTSSGATTCSRARSPPLAGETGFEPGRLELVDAGVFLGPLADAELEALWPARRPVSAAQLEPAQRAWDGVRAPEPEPGPVEALLAVGTEALPFLGAALRRFLEELPDARGLACSERQLLELLVERPRMPRELFVAAQALEEAPYDGDTWCWRRLHALGVGPRPLVARADAEPLAQPPPLGDAQ